MRGADFVMLSVQPAIVQRVLDYWVWTDLTTPPKRKVYCLSCLYDAWPRDLHMYFHGRQKSSGTRPISTTVWLIFDGGLFGVSLIARLRIERSNWYKVSTWQNAASKCSNNKYETTNEVQNRLHIQRMFLSRVIGTRRGSSMSAIPNVTDSA